jgi:hypothetical protein
MPRDKQEVIPATRPQNRFAALAGSDSDDEQVPMAPIAPIAPVPIAPAPIAPLPIPPSSPPLRTWPSNDKTTIFNSPFSTKKTRWSKPRFKEDTEGWVSILWNKPQFQEENGSNPPPLTVQYKPRTPTFYPLVVDPDAETKVLEDDSPLYVSVTPPTLDLGESIVNTVVLEETITPSAAQDEQLTALAWAERVKKSLEKAEAARASKGRTAPQADKADEDFNEALGRLSFFRRGMATSSSE